MWFRSSISPKKTARRARAEPVAPSFSPAGEAGEDILGSPGGRSPHDARILPRLLGRRGGAIDAVGQIKIVQHFDDLDFPAGQSRAGEALEGVDGTDPADAPFSAATVAEILTEIPSAVELKAAPEIGELKTG